MIIMGMNKLMAEAKNVAYCVGMDPKDYAAARSVFPDATMMDFQTYDKTYEAVANGECDVAVVPFEKSFSGEVGHVLDLLFAGDLKVCHAFGFDNGMEVVRYAVISREEVKPEDGDLWFLMMFTVKDETGSLAKAINIISSYGYNMRILRSRPMKDLPWHYYFYCEAQGDDTTENGKQMLAVMQAACPSVKVLGRYAE